MIELLMPRSLRNFPEAPEARDQGKTPELASTDQPQRTEPDAARPDPDSGAITSVGTVESEPEKAASQATSPASSEAKDPDRAGRFLIVDVYPYDLAGKPNWPALVAASDATNEYVGAILKATEGTTDIILKNNPYPSLSSWFRAQWKAERDAGGDRYGIDWFRGAYHFLKFNQDPGKQAEFYVRTIAAAGGFEHGDISPIVDVELGSATNSNQNATTQQIIDCTSAFAARTRQLTGRKIVLYGRGAMRDKGIASKMGCDVVWNPSYTSKMVTNGLIPPWTIDDLALWQYTDGEVDALPGYPIRVPGFGAVDLSVYIDGALKPTLATLRARLL
jgi:GH25 family lysozyme M1 (1,4-beta-N-acetylmuramidase)